MIFMSLRNTVDYQVYSLELLEMLNTNNALLLRVLEIKGIKIHLAFSAALHLLSVELGLLPGGQQRTFTTSSPRRALCSVHTPACLDADFAL